MPPAQPDQHDRPSTKPTTQADVHRKLFHYYRDHPAVFGGADILNLHFATPQVRTSIYLDILSCIRQRDDDCAAVQKFVVVVPRGQEIADYANMPSLLSVDDPDAPDEVLVTLASDARFRGRLQIVSTEDCCHESVLAVLRDQPVHTAAIVVDASIYRNENVSPFTILGSSARPEDFWAPQIHALAAAAVDVAVSNDMYVLLDTGEFTPTRPALADLLLTINNCGVFGSTYQRGVDYVLASRSEQWDNWLNDGRLGRAIRDIDEVPSISARNRRFLWAQLFHRVGLYAHTLPEIRELANSVQALDASSRLKLARMALDASAFDVASKALDSALDHLADLERLESALTIAQELGSQQLQAKCVTRLNDRFPNSRPLRDFRHRKLLANRDYRGLASLDYIDAKTRALYALATTHFSAKSTPDYAALIGNAAREQQDVLRELCVRDALDRHLFGHAVTLALPQPDRPPKTASLERLLVRTLEAVFAHAQPDVQSPISEEQLCAGYLALVRRLAADPANQRLRADLERLVGPQVAGTTGLALAITAMRRLAQAPTRPRGERLPPTPPVSWLSDHESFFERAFDWLRGEAPLRPGHAPLPKELLTEDADVVVSAITNLLEAAPLDSEEDIDAAFNMIALGTATHPHGETAYGDLVMMQLLGIKLATVGPQQRARNLAEEILLAGSGTSIRRRRAWLAVADIYLRCGDHLAGALYLACALAVDTAVDDEQLWQEINCRIRLLRDAGLLGLLRDTIGHARGHLQRRGLLEAYEHRLATLELSARQLLLPENATPTQVSSLLADATAVGVRVLDRQDETEPMAMLLGQLINSSHDAGIETPTESQSVYRALCEHVRDGRMRQMVDAFSSAAPTVEQLVDFVCSSDPATLYSHDAGYDRNQVAVLARRVLSNPDTVRNRESTAFTLEQIADQGVGVPGWDATPTPPDTLSRIHVAVRTLRDVSKSGINVVQAAFDRSGKLIRTSTVNGLVQGPIREPVKLFSLEHLRTWSREYPRRYAYSNDPNVFYTTTERLRFSDLPDGPTVVIPDVELQAFPPNLLYVNNNFAGQTQPISAAPSLAWLAAAQSRRLIGDGRMCAWIPTDPTKSTFDALPVLAERLAQTFEVHGIAVDHAPDLPASLAGASVAIIAAHGAVQPEGRYFRVVADEHEFRATAADLARALRNVGLVVLFVCSGARSDKHPAANTTIGLARQVLDRGCCATIGSPWPLKSFVAAYWLPEFLAKWTTGSTLVEANFAANQAVAAEFSDSPVDCLAMTVFGNPMLRFMP